MKILNLYITLLAISINIINANIFYEKIKSAYRTAARFTNYTIEAISTRGTSILGSIVEESCVHLKPVFVERQRFQQTSFIFGQEFARIWHDSNYDHEIHHLSATGGKEKKGSWEGYIKSIFDNPATKDLTDSAATAYWEKRGQVLKDFLSDSSDECKFEPSKCQHNVIYKLMLKFTEKSESGSSWQGTVHSVMNNVINPLISNECLTGIVTIFGTYFSPIKLVVSVFTIYRITPDFVAPLLYEVFRLLESAGRIQETALGLIDPRLPPELLEELLLTSYPSFIQQKATESSGLSLTNRIIYKKWSAVALREMVVKISFEQLPRFYALLIKYFPDDLWGDENNIVRKGKNWIWGGPHDLLLDLAPIVGVFRAGTSREAKKELKKLAKAILKIKTPNSNVLNILSFYIANLGIVEEWSNMGSLGRRLRKRCQLLSDALFPSLDRIQFMIRNDYYALSALVVRFPSTYLLSSQKDGLAFLRLASKVGGAASYLSVLMWSHRPTCMLIYDYRPKIEERDDLKDRSKQLIFDVYAYLRHLHVPKKHEQNLSVNENIQPLQGVRKDICQQIHVDQNRPQEQRSEFSENLKITHQTLKLDFLPGPQERPLSPKEIINVSIAILVVVWDAPVSSLVDESRMGYCGLGVEICVNAMLEAFCGMISGPKFIVDREGVHSNDTFGRLKLDAEIKTPEFNANAVATDDVPVTKVPRKRKRNKTRRKRKRTHRSRRKQKVKG